jgi:hypothetical protein
MVVIILLCRVVAALALISCGLALVLADFFDEVSGGAVWMGCVLILVGLAYMPELARPSGKP